MVNHHRRWAVFLYLVGFVAMTVACTRGPRLHPVTEHEAVGTWCGEDGDRLILAADRTFSASDVSPRLVHYLDKINESYPTTRKAAITSLKGVWMLGESDQRQLVLTASFSDGDPSLKGIKMIFSYATPPPTFVFDVFVDGVRDYLFLKC